MSDPTEPEESTLDEFQDLIDDQVNGESDQDEQDDQGSNDSDDGDDE